VTKNIHDSTITKVFHKELQLFNTDQFPTEI